MRTSQPEFLVLIGIFFLGVLGMIPLTLWDQQFTTALAAVQWPAFENFMAQSMFEGEPFGGGDIGTLLLIGSTVLYLLACVFPSSRLRAWRPYLGFLMFTAVVGGILLVHGGKLTFGRVRPPELVERGLSFTPWYVFGPFFVLAEKFNASFPSGHTATASLSLALVPVCWHSLRESHKRRAWTGFVLLLCGSYALTMAVSRVMAGNHYVTDVWFSFVAVGGLCQFGFYYLLAVPEQVAAQQGETPATFPLLWELRLLVLTFIGVLGVMAAVAGLRAISLGPSWGPLLIPAGLAVTALAWCLGRRLRRRVFAQA